MAGATHLDVEGARTVGVGGWHDEGVIARVDGDEFRACRHRIRAREAVKARRAGPHLAEHGVDPEPAEHLRPLMRRAERDDASDAGGTGTHAGARHEPSHAVRDDVHVVRARLAADAVDHARQTHAAPLDVAPQGDMSHRVEVDPSVAPQATREPQKVRGVLEVAVEQDNGRVLEARVERPHASAAEGERSDPGEDGRRDALERERPHACRPGGGFVLVGSAGRRTTAPIRGGGGVCDQVERERAGRDCQRESDEEAEHGHTPTTTRLARRVKCKLAFPGNGA